MYYSDIHNLDVANGPGIRVSLFVSGCPHHCYNCFNKETWNYDYGNPFTKDTMDKLLMLLNNPQIKGFTLLGGEPFAPENQEGCSMILEKIKREFPKKDIWCFTGYLFWKDIIENMRKELPYTDKMLRNIDIIVDGPFIQKLKNPSLKFKGSENQKTIDVQKSLKTGKEILLPGFNDNLVT